MKEQSVETCFTMNILLPEYVCPCCGKRFVMSVGTDIKHYTYKMMNGRRVQYMCSYHCFRAAHKQEEERRAKQRAASRKKMAEVFSKTAKARAAKIRSEKNEATHSDDCKIF